MAFLKARSLMVQWWQRWKDTRDFLAALDQCGPDEVKLIARDLSLTTGELRTFASSGAVNSAGLLYRRMADLGLGRAEPMAMREMQKLCTLCESKGRCERDLVRGADPSAWHAYCPNDGTLQGLMWQAAKLSNRIGSKSTGRPKDKSLPTVNQE